MRGLRVPRDVCDQVRLCEGPLAVLKYRNYIPHIRSRWSVRASRQKSVLSCPNRPARSNMRNVIWSPGESDLAVCGQVRFAESLIFIPLY